METQRNFGDDAQRPASTIRYVSTAHRVAAYGHRVASYAASVPHTAKQHTLRQYRTQTLRNILYWDCGIFSLVLGWGATLRLRRAGA
eukprot:3252367-Rhodomonas_salina.1